VPEVPALYTCCSDWLVSRVQSLLYPLVRGNQTCLECGQRVLCMSYTSCHSADWVMTLTRINDPLIVLAFGDPTRLQQCAELLLDACGV